MTRGGSGYSQSLVSPLYVSGPPVFRDATPLALSIPKYQALKSAPGRQITLSDLPLGGTKRVDVIGERFAVWSPDARLFVGNKPVARPDVTLLRGRVAQEPASEVFLGLSPHGCNGWIRTQGAVYVIAAGRKPANRDLTVYNASTHSGWLTPDHGFLCGIDRLGQRYRPILEGGATSQSGDCRAARIAVETDREFTSQLFNDDPNSAAAYVAQLYGALTTIFERDLSTKLSVGYLRLWDGSSTCPWDQINIYDQLTQYRSEYMQMMQGVPRAVSQFLSGRALEGAGGLAYIGSLCDATYGYSICGGIQGTFPPGLEPDSGNWDPMVAGHEMGHNFGSLHTHDVDPPIDTCGLGCNDPPFAGTIMSYCQLCPGGVANIQLAFHPQCVDMMLAYMDGWAVCDLKTASVRIQTDFGGTCACNGLAGVVEFREPGTATVLSSANVVLNAGGVAIIPAVDVRHYDVTLKLGGHLRDISPGALIAAPLTELSFTPTGGNADDNNTVDLFDMNIVLGNFATSEELGDLNRDGLVDLLDLNTVFTNFGATGAP